MNLFKKLYYNNKWYDFANKVKIRDKYECKECGRKKDQVILQVHHKKYKIGLKPWEYAISDCITLCKGCHAEEHDLIQPSKGSTTKISRTLTSINDSGELDGKCERRGCGKISDIDTKLTTQIMDI